jgi:hypothetical protein
MILLIIIPLDNHMNNHMILLIMIKLSFFSHINSRSNMVPWPRDLEDFMEERMDDSFS